MKITKDLVYGVMTVFGAALIHLTFGFIYTVGMSTLNNFDVVIGNMNPYLIAYMNITKSQSTFFNSAMLAAQATFMPVGSYIGLKTGWIPVTIASMFCTA